MEMNRNNAHRPRRSHATWKKVKSSKYPSIFEVLRNRIFIVVAVANIATVSGKSYCSEIQTAELGKEGIIECDFPGNIFDIKWYEDLKLPPIASMLNSNSDALDNKTYKVLENGSLRINKVTVEHERNFSVLVFNTLDSFDDPRNISLKVIADPGNGSIRLECNNSQQNYSYLGEESGTTIYYYNLLRLPDQLQSSDGERSTNCPPNEENVTLTGYFNISRPQVVLEWFRWSPQGDLLFLTNQTNVVNNSDGTYNSSLALNLTRSRYDLMALLVFKASWDSLVWDGRFRETQVLLDFSDPQLPFTLKPHTIHIEVNRRAEVRCEGNGNGIIIWKKISDDHKTETIGFSTGNVAKMTANIPDATISVEGSLVFSLPQVHNEGLYACVPFTSEGNQINMIEVEVLVPPTPPYIQIRKCKDTEDGYCTFQANDTDRVTCAVNGVRPNNVILKWISRDGRQIFSQSKPNNVKENHQTFDVSVDYKVPEMCGEDILIECRMYGPLANIMKAHASVTIVRKPCPINLFTSYVEKASLYGWIGALLVSIGAYLLIPIIMKRQIEELKNQVNSNTQTIQEMQHNRREVHGETTLETDDIQMQFFSKSTLKTDLKQTWTQG